MREYTKMEPIGQETVVQRVVQQITSAMAAGRFKMGLRLPNEFELMEELQVSRNSLREAMKILSAMGIVEVKRGDGTYICSEIKPNMFDSVVYSLMLENSPIEEVIEFRQALDEMVLRMAMRKCTAKEIDKLKELIRTMRTCFAEGQISKAARTDYAFHIYLAECTKNQFLLHIVKGVYAIYETSIEKNIRNEELFARADQHHMNIVRCIERRDESAIEQVIAESLSTWRKNIRERSESTESDA